MPARPAIASPAPDQRHEVLGRVRWPYGFPENHEPCCILHGTNGVGECDCKASDASDEDWGDL